MVKVISLSEEAYKALKRLKGENMSFSDVILKSISNKHGEKTENIMTIIEWVENQKSSGRKKEKISTRVDELVYGVKK